MNLLIWIVFGLIVGVIAELIDPSPNQGGLLGAMVLGIVGALVGGFLGRLILGIGITGFNFSSLVVAVLGSLLLLALMKALRRANY